MAARPKDLPIQPIDPPGGDGLAPIPPFSKAKPGRRPVLTHHTEKSQQNEEVPTTEIICIDDEEEGHPPLKQLNHHVDSILMPPPVDTTLISRQAVPLASQALQIPKPKGLDLRRKTKPLKLQVRQVAKMCTGPMDHRHAQMMAQLTSAVVPIHKLQITENATVRIPPTPQQPKPTTEAPNPQ